MILGQWYGFVLPKRNLVICFREMLFFAVLSKTAESNV